MIHEQVDVRELVQRYRQGGPKLAAAIAGLTKDDLLAFPVPGQWSIQQVVLHLMDSDLIASDRMKRVIAEDSPTLIGFDESAFARGLHYDRMDAQLATDLFARNRQLTHSLLSLLPEQSFARRGMHNERGEITLADLVRYMTDHVDHHLAFIFEKRRLLGKPLSELAADLPRPSGRPR